MGWSTTVVVPPDGDMAQYMASLDKLRQRDDRIYFPAHGPPVTRPKQYVRSLIGHRLQREAQILRLVGEKPRGIPDIVAEAYLGSTRAWLRRPAARCSPICWTSNAAGSFSRTERHGPKPPEQAARARRDCRSADPRRAARHHLRNRRPHLRCRSRSQDHRQLEPRIDARAKPAGHLRRALRVGDELAPEPLDSRPSAP